MSPLSINRRTLLGGTVGFCASASLGLFACQQGKQIFARRERLPNPWLENGKPVVVVIRGSDFNGMLAKGLELLGGFGKFGSAVPVMIKPNFISPSAYPETTDGSSIVAVVEALKRDGFNDITIADAGARSRPAKRSFDFHSLVEKSAAGGFRLRDLADDNYLLVKDDAWTYMPEIEVFESAYRAPLIVNMPVVKQHSRAQFSCALKNNVGPITFISRSALHRAKEIGELPTEAVTGNMKKAIAEVAAAVNPEITIIDAREVMSRAHHRSQGGNITAASRIIISGDMLAADRVAAQVLAECGDGFEVSMTVDTFNHAASLGLGAAGLDDVIVKEISA